MFDVLLASGHTTAARPVATASSLSLVTHAALATLVLFVLRTDAVRETARLLDTTMVFLRPPAEAPKPRAEPPPEAARVAPPTTAVVAPPPKGFQTIAPPSEIPKVIPPVNLSERPFDPRDFSGRGVEGGVADGVVGGIGPVADRRPVSEAIVYHAVDLDVQVRLLAQPPLRYPPALEAARIEGSVAMEFVVGTDGRVEQGSLRVLDSTDPRFEPAAREVVLGSRFAPARLGGQPVRQLVRQRYRFTAAG